MTGKFTVVLGLFEDLHITIVLKCIFTANLYSVGPH